MDVIRPSSHACQVVFICAPKARRAPDRAGVRLRACIRQRALQNGNCGCCRLSCQIPAARTAYRGRRQRPLLGLVCYRYTSATDVCRRRGRAPSCALPSRTDGSQSHRPCHPLARPVGLFRVFEYAQEVPRYFDVAWQRGSLSHWVAHRWAMPTNGARCGPEIMVPGRTGPGPAGRSCPRQAVPRRRSKRSTPRRCRCFPRGRRVRRSRG